MKRKRRQQSYSVVSFVVLALTASGCSSCELVRNHHLTVSPSNPAVGQETVFTASWRLRDPGATVVKDLFDLDGDGDFEAAGLPVTPPSGNDYATEARHTYTAPGSVLTRHMVRAQTTSQNITGFDVAVETAVVDVGENPGQSPMASFTVTPNPVRPEQDVTFDASASTGGTSNGATHAVSGYAWDLDGDGSYETDGGSNPVYVLKDGYPSVGDRTVGLQVTDDVGSVGTTTRTVMVRFSRRVQIETRIQKRLSDSGEVFSLAPNGHTVDEGTPYVNGDELIISDVEARGRLPARLFPEELRRGMRKVRADAIVQASIDLETDLTRANGFALLTFPAGGRACLAFQATGSATATPSGRYRVLGGRGRDADRLRGVGTAEGMLTTSGIEINGQANFRLRGEQPFRLGRSGCGPLR
jgi:hypothetical protein